MECIRAAQNAGFLSPKEITALDFPEYAPASLQKNTARVMMVEDTSLALELWSRIEVIVKEHLPTVSYTDYYTSGDATDNTLTMSAVGVCPLMRVIKYEAGQQFYPHKDGIAQFLEPCLII